MKILHVIRDLSPLTGGPVTAVVGMAEAESMLGHSVTIAATDYALKDLPIVAGVRILVFPCLFSGWRWSSGLARALPELVIASDVVHIHTVWEHPTWASANFCRKFAKPYILRTCGMLDRWSLSQSTWKKRFYLYLMAASVISNASAIHFTTEEELSSSLTLGNENQCFIIPNGLPATAFQGLPGPQAFWHRFPELTDKRIVLFLGRLHNKKQPDVVIKAFGKVCGIDARLALVLAGPAEPGYLVKLRALATDLGLLDRITFTGLLQGAAVREAFCAAELFVIPSLQENFGIAVAEAMAAGCPVIVSRQVNLATEIHAAQAGLVCKADVESTASAMEQLIKSDSLRARIGENGRNLVLDKFTWPKVAGELITVYEDILSSVHTSKAWSKKQLRSL